MKTKTPTNGAMACESPGQQPAVPKKPIPAKVPSGRPRGQAPKGKRWSADMQGDLTTGTPSLLKVALTRRLLLNPSRGQCVLSFS
jgi:hypothetical protein